GSSGVWPESAPAAPCRPRAPPTKKAEDRNQIEMLKTSEMEALPVRRPLACTRLLGAALLRAAAGERAPRDPAGALWRGRAEVAGPPRQRPAAAEAGELPRANQSAGPSGPGPASAIALSAGGGMQLAGGTGEPFMFAAYAMANCS
ncbi:unnamed protein product, partial [Prorocentrum cordatum]